MILGYRISSVVRGIFFPFQNNHKNLDPSYKMDLDLWDCLGRLNLYYSKISQDRFSIFIVIYGRENPRLIAE